MADSGGIQEVIDIDSDDSSDSNSEFTPAEHADMPYRKIQGSNFFNRLNTTVQDDMELNGELDPSQLWLSSTDWMARTNKEKHRTDQFDNKKLIVRRGQEFTMKIKFDREFDESKHSFTLSFYTGDKPSIGKGTLFTLRKSASLSPHSWGFTVDSTDKECVTITVMPAVTSPAGIYKLLIESSCRDPETLNSHTTKYSCSDDMYVLFNAWCKEDPVYMEGQEEKEEYVLNDVGLIWVGTHRDNEPIPWNFGQYEMCVLECVVFLFARANLSVAARSDPVKLTRALSALVNSTDDDGVLTGRWTESFPPNTTDPCNWVGSVEILRLFVLLQTSVRYGQCWVFSGILTTILRCLGIPCRSVTNFESGHDTDCSHSIDCHYDSEGNPMEDLDDSIWNFHVWNEAWFRRGDLPEGYDGWQAVDATPQEASESVMRCGPCPVKAIKEGDLYLPYDVGFLFAEVNGDRIWWRVEKDGDMAVEYIDRNCIGKHISTKAVGSKKREDLTSSYKYAEGSEEEREVQKKVAHFSSRKEWTVKSTSRDLEVEIQQETTLMGSDLVIPVKLNNTNESSSRTVSVSANVRCSAYTGRTDNTCPVLKTVHSVHEVSAGESDTVTITIPPSDYVKKIKAGSVINLFLQTRVQETKQVFATRESFNVKKGSGVTIMCSAKTVKQYEDFEVTVTYTNSSPTKLTRCHFYLEGPGIRRSKKLYCGTVQANSTIERKISLSAHRMGERTLLVKFCNSKVAKATDQIQITVEEAEPTEII